MLDQHGISAKWLAVDEFLSEMATTLFPPNEEQDKYKITNAISRLLLRIPGVHALNYPSVATRLKNINLCMEPKIADQFMPAEAWMIRIEEAAAHSPGLDDNHGPFYRTTFVRKSELIYGDGRIRWSEVLRDVQPHEIAHLAYRPRNYRPWLRQG